MLVDSPPAALLSELEKLWRKADRLGGYHEERAAMFGFTARHAASGDDAKAMIWQIEHYVALTCHNPTLKHGKSDVKRVARELVAAIEQAPANLTAWLEAEAVKSVQLEHRHMNAHSVFGYSHGQLQAGHQTAAEMFERYSGDPDKLAKRCPGDDLASRIQDASSRGSADGYNQSMIKVIELLSNYCNQAVAA